MADAQTLPCRLGELRWRCTLANRTDVQDRNSAGMIEDYRTIATVWAKIAPIRLLEFVGPEQIEMPFTHEIIFRWKPFEDVEYFDVVLRTIFLPDGRQRREVYRIRRVKEWEGRHRFIVCEAELEKFQL